MNFNEDKKKSVFVNNIKLNKTENDKGNKTPHVSTKVSAYDRVVQLVTNDNTDTINQNVRGGTATPTRTPIEGVRMSENQKKRISGQMF